MKHIAISTENAPKAIGPYSQAVRVADTVYISGQLPIDPVSQAMPEGIKEQTRQSMENLKAILADQNAGMDDIVQTTVFMQDLEDFGKMNEVYAEYFTTAYPARAAFQVARLPKDALLEIQAIAVI